MKPRYDMHIRTTMDMINEIKTLKDSSESCSAFVRKAVRAYINSIKTQRAQSTIREPRQERFLDTTQG